MSAPTAPATYEFPATPTQAALWFIHAMEPAGTAYHIPLAFALQGPLDATALKAALDALVARHEILRTVYVERDGTLMQRVLPALPMAWSYTSDESSASVPRPDVRALATACITEPFDLAHGGPLRARLWSWGAEEHLLVLVLHHIAGDHSAVALFADELASLYRSAVAGGPVELPPLTLQFADYAVWVREQDLPRSLATGLAAWERALEGHSGVLALPTTRTPDPADAGVPGSRGAVMPVVLSPAVSAAVRRFARAERLSPFSVLLGAFQALLHLHTGQRDILVGIPFANRGTDERLERVLGCFINTLPVPVMIDAREGFAALLQESRRGLLHAQSFQGVPFDTIVERVKPPRAPHRNPLYQVGFVLQDGPIALRLDGIRCTDLGAHSGDAMYDLHLWLSETPADGGIAGTAWYDATRFNESDVRALMGRFEPLLAALIERPTVPLSSISVATAAERAQLAEWNATTRAWPDTASVLDLIAAQVAATPRATAVSGDSGSLSYAVMFERAEALARALTARGLGRGDLIGICVPRDAGMLVALLGVLRSGAAYVPLDPGYPQERLAYIARDAGLAALIVDADALPGRSPFAVPVRCATLPLTRDGRLPDAAQSATSPASLAPPAPADLAYVIYTSGSTGRPKGVAVPHRGVVNLLRSMQEEPGFTPADRLLAVTTLSFDIAVLELLLPLVSGGAVVIASADAVHDPDALAALIETHGITTMQATPGTWRSLIEAGWHSAGAPSTRFRAFCGGEPLPAALATALLPRVTELWNLYGPTETTVWSTRDRVRADGPITIGRPLANTTCHVMSSTGQELPTGIAGELVIGGAGVTAGYLHQPELTATRFIDDPQGGGVRFHTGDRAVRAHDGRLICLGRADDQVKVNGHRVELGEVESVLAEHPAVREAAVRVSLGDDGDARLIAYVVTDPGATIVGSEVRRTLRTRLPDYMVPAMVLPIAALPRTPNGKRDRAALPDPLGASREHGFVAPRTEVERIVAEVWCELLGIPRVGLTDNFFEIGGHSLLAIRATARLRERLIGRTQVRPDPRAFFFQTLEQVAASLAATTSQEAIS